MRIINGYEIKPGADLSEANLFKANLSDVNLSEADLIGANLFRANLRSANLSEANLFRANLNRANLSEADLSGANLIGANLSDANLSDADLSDAKLGNNNALIIPKSKNIKFNINIGRERTRIGCIDKLNTFWLEDSTELNELINENKITNVELYRNLIWYGIYRGSM